MKVFVLTISTREENLEPEVFMTREAAQEKMEGYCKGIEEDFADAVFSVEINDGSAEVIYTDDTYEIYEIFEVEVQGE